MDAFFIFYAKYLYLACFLMCGIYFLATRRSTQIQFVCLGLCCALLSYAVALVTGMLYFDPRPFVEGHLVPLIAHDTENGFPSDHVLRVSCLAIVVSFFNVRMSVLLWAFTFLIAYARVYVGVHHYVDVVASMVIALVVSIPVYLLLYNQYIIPLSARIESRYFSSRNRCPGERGIRT